MGLGRLAVEGDRLVERAFGHRAVGVRRERARVEAIEPLGRDAARLGHPHHLARDLDIHVAVRRIGQRVRDGVIGQRGGEELRPIRELAPEVAPDVRGHDGAVVEVQERAVQLPDARRHAPVDLAEHDCAAAGVLDHTRLEVVRSEVDEAAHRARVADDRLDDQLVQPVLRRYDVPVGPQVPRERARGRFGVLRLHRKDDLVELAAQLVGGHGGYPGVELREWPLDAEPSRVHCGDVLLHPVNERDVMPCAGEMRTDRSADRASAPDQ